MINYCEACKVNIKDETSICPLCLNSVKKNDSNNKIENIYPIIIENISPYKFIKRLLVFLSVLIITISITINLYLKTSLWWSIIIISVVLYSWIAIQNILMAGYNWANKILVQVLLTSILFVILDIETGKLGWSFTYAIPFILSIGTISVTLLIMFNRTNWSRYMLFQILLALFGFTPLIFHFFKLSDNFLITIITSLISFASLLATIIFGDRTLKNEFKRRFHF